MCTEENSGARQREWWYQGTGKLHEEVTAEQRFAESEGGILWVSCSRVFCAERTLLQSS